MRQLSLFDLPSPEKKEDTLHVVAGSVVAPSSAWCSTKITDPQYKSLVMSSEPEAGWTVHLVDAVFADPTFSSLVVPEAVLANKNSKWKVMSALQKAIRRGNVERAVVYATALAKDDLYNFWRRAKIIAFEDIGVANLLVVATVCALMETYKSRGDFLKMAAYAASLMASSVKDRTVCDLSNLCSYLPKPKEEDIGESPATYIEKFCDYGSGTGDAVQACLAGKVLLGEFFQTDKKRWLSAFLSAVKETQPPLVYYIARSSVSNVEGMAPCLPVAFACLPLDGNVSITNHVEELTESPTVFGVMSCALDAHTVEGKKAFAYFQKACEPFKDWCGSVADKVGDRMGYLVKSVIFHAEGTQMDCRLSSPFSDHVLKYQREENAIGFGIDYESFMAGVEIVRSNISQLNYARKKVCGEG